MRDFRSGAMALVFCFMAPGQSASFQTLDFSVAGGGDLQDDLRNSSLLAAAKAERVTDPQEVLAAARADYARLVGALYAEGHFGGVINILIDGVEAAQISPLTRLDRIGTVTVRVAPGPVYRFSRTQIIPLAPATELPEGFAVGAPARTPVIEDAAGVAVSAWRQTGRAKADIADQRVIAQHDADRLAVDIAVAPGPLVRFGELILRGSDAVRPERLRAIAGLPVGEIFDPDAVDLAEARLRRTQVFSSVALTEAERLGPGNTLDITAQLAAQKPRRFGFGAEISSVEGLTLSSFWLHRNLLGGAERLRIDGAISGIGGATGGTDYSFGARFERPATFSPQNDLFIEARLERLDEEDFTSDVGTIGAGITRMVNEDVELEYGLAYRFSRVEDANGQTDYSLLTAPLKATYDTREEPLDPKAGFFVDLGIAPFLGLNDATDNGVRATFDARSYLSFGTDERFTLAGRLQGGSIGGADLEGVPNEYRFYSGGGGTVRGHDYQALGVELNGISSGGASYLGLSAELRAGVTERIGAVAFADFGIVGEDSFPGSDADSHSGAGLGLRYRTPIGPIRLDVAAPVSGDGNGVQVYVGIGQAF